MEKNGLTMKYQEVITELERYNIEIVLISEKHIELNKQVRKTKKGISTVIKIKNKEYH